MITEVVVSILFPILAKSHKTESNSGMSRSNQNTASFPNHYQKYQNQNIYLKYIKMMKYEEEKKMDTLTLSNDKKFSSKHRFETSFN